MIIFFFIYRSQFGIFGEENLIVRINVFFTFKNKGRILLFPKNGPTFGKILFFWSKISNIMIAQKLFRWWAQMAEDNLFHDILIIGTSSWDYEDNFDPISRKKILISRKNLHFLCPL